MEIEGGNIQNAALNTASQTSTGQLPNTQTLGKDDFLKLLVTQLNYQDPLEPLTNEEFIAQTAQFSTLEQIQELNKTVLNQITLQRTISNAMAVQYVGKTVEAPGSKVALINGALGELGAKLPENAEVQFGIYNDTGQLVSLLDLGPQNAQTIRIKWDGRDENNQPLPDGIYTFKVSATNDNGETIHPTPIMSGEVSSVTYEQGQAFLSVYGELISPGDIFSASSGRQASAATESQEAFIND